MQRLPKIKETGFLDGDGAETASTISNTDSNYEEQLCMYKWCNSNVYVQK